MIWNQAELHRAHCLIGETINSRLGLDLQGTTVITEAATGPFAVTASIAARAGANVEAIAADSSHGSSSDAAEATLAVARACHVQDRVKIVARSSAAFERADIVTNLGFVRPFDTSLISRLRHGCVIPLMYDAREMRPGEIDTSLCQARGITVVGTNEDHPMVDVLRYCGHLVAKLLMEQEIEILRSRILVLGDNLFTPHVGRELHSLGADLRLCRNWAECGEETENFDALVYIDYWNRAGAVSFPDVGDWLKQHTHATLIQLVGGLEISPFVSAGWRVLPERALPAQRMYRTLADLGVRPVIELHAAGLKAAELELKGIPCESSGRLNGLRQSMGGTMARTPVSPHALVLV